MEIKRKSILIILALSMIIKTESSMELKSYTACYGILGNQNFLLPSCPTGQKIAVMAVYTLAKYKSTGCPQIQTSPGDDPACCQYDVTDCSYLYDSGSFRVYYQTCNGESSCTIQVSWIDIPSSCNSSVYIERTHYMKMDYYCISDQAVDPCTDLTTSDSPTFFWNTGYPAEMTATSTSCTCSVEMSCDTTVELTAMDLQLEYAGNCNQSFTVADGNSLSTFDCSNNNDFIPKVIYTSSGHFIKILIENNLGTTGGKFLIHVRGTNPKGEVTLSCGASALTVSSQNTSSLPTCPVEGGTTINLPTTEPSTQTEYSTTLKAMSSDSSSVSPTISTMDFTAPTARITENSTTPTVKTTENSTTPTARITEDSTEPTALTTDDSTAPNTRTTEDSATPTDWTTEDSTTSTNRISDSSTVSLTSFSNVQTNDSTAPTVKTTEDSTTLTNRTTEISTTPTTRTTENSATPTDRTTKDSRISTDRTTESSKFLPTSFPIVQTEDPTTTTAMSTDLKPLSLSTQAATTSGFSLNMTTILNVLTKSTSDVASVHSTPPQTSTDLPTVTATEPCCKDSNTTKKTHISSSSPDSETVGIAVGVGLSVLFIIILGIMGIGYYCKKRRPASSNSNLMPMSFNYI